MANSISLLQLKEKEEENDDEQQQPQKVSELKFIEFIFIFDAIRKLYLAALRLQNFRSEILYSKSNEFQSDILRVNFLLL